MDRFSRKKTARAAVALLQSHPPATVAKVLAALLVEQRATRELDLLIEDMRVELLRAQGQAIVTVKTARELSGTLRTKLERVLKQHLAATTISVDTALEPSLKGGLVAITPAGELNASVVKQLHNLKQL